LSTQNILMSMEKSISAVNLAIQNTVKYRRFKKSINSIKDLSDGLTTLMIPSSNINLFDQEKEKEIRFNNICKLVNDKNTIKSFTDMLSSFYNCYTLNEEIAQKLTARKMLTMWIVIGFPEYTIEKTQKELVTEKKDIYPNEIYYISLEFLVSFQQMVNTNMMAKQNRELFRKFTKNLNRFSNAITYFLGRDKMEQTIKCVQEYYDINETIMMIKVNDKYTETMKQQNEASLNKTKERILAHINKFDPTIKKDELEAYANMNLLKSIKVEEAQFEIMIDDIRTKRLFYFRKAIVWIKDSLLELKATKTSKGYDIVDILDADFIAQKMMVSANFGGSDVDTYGNYIVAIINELQAAESVEETNQKWKEIKTINKDKPMHVYLANMIFFSMKEIHKIFEAIQMMMTLSAVGINPLSLK
jgi:hypothetical protein